MKTGHWFASRAPEAINKDSNVLTKHGHFEIFLKISKRATPLSVNPLCGEVRLCPNQPHANQGY
jgi:hypothetical protein